MDIVSYHAKVTFAFESKNQSFLKQSLAGATLKAAGAKAARSLHHLAARIVDDGHGPSPNRTGSRLEELAVEALREAIGHAGDIVRHHSLAPLGLDAGAIVLRQAVQVTDDFLE